ncbi:aminopeptidase M18 family [Gottschalkia acidurici 9a]|uniref:M18 family aminopeptidase n=1 Tax=Gottschalkia acidurici (strain ATCC 7906 / DSM 604 / BCRC 14475 / CIP 104303 / KCTC 5404 / NCIMB 10678 / 9a) TaxID=1128398 RepID=K0AZ77_GOTA9|nr:aminopeptidase [Gottschalkia acidurici]AFS78000.1 aminopeptidase M18 family [Gottschalkia acidurici 9a]
MIKKTDGKALQEKLTHKWRNVWEELEDSQLDIVKNMGEEYKIFLDKGKTEREVVSNIVKMAEENGYVSLESIIKKKIKVVPGTKIYANNKDKSVAMFIIGKEKIEDGMNIIASHVDSPRIDLKQFPLYEQDGLGLLKTHYYGGVKKYQWVTLPLSLHGVVIKSNGEKIHITIGEDEKDPVFFITDLLPHLAKDQMEKKMGEGITGEGLNILFGSIPYNDSEISEKVKLNILNILNEKYGIMEQDFTTAEFEIVPAGKARDVGIDRSMIGGYGQDDRVCVYTSLKSMLDTSTPNRTAVALFSDKEEVGSLGNTGMESRFFENAVAEIINLTEESYNELKLKRALANSKVLSADTVGAFDPNYPDVLDKRNSPFLGKGICLVKYTGARGKSSTNDANSEYISEIRKIFNNNNIIWQMGELGKVDQGGGGTIAYILANYGAEVVDCGVSLLSVHGPFEISSKADIYMTYEGYKAFYKEA